MARDQIYLNDQTYDYMMKVSSREPELLARLRVETKKLALGFWQVPATEGQFLNVLVKALRPKRILEIGTFTGYSSLSMAWALPPGGRIVCCDISKEFTDIAQRYWQEAGVADRIELRLGKGVELMDGLVAEGAKESFDLVFIDANKDDYDAYYERALLLAKKGALIAIDNTLFDGRVVGQNLEGLADWQIMFTEALKVFNLKLHTDKRVALSLIPVGDGITLCVKE
ncbi:MAG: class I SAM-dependent methyltransferase [Rhodospirillaceae bacterium]|nr:class I SAM-dependent methyltransferase [Rhodospirillaceae bacterium]